MAIETKSIEIEAQTQEEGLKKAAEILGKRIEELDIEVLEQRKKGLFGKAKPFKFKVSIKEEVVEEIPEEVKEVKREDVAIGDITTDLGIYEFTEDGVYLTVFSPVADEVKAEFVQLLEEIDSWGIIAYDTDAMTQAIDNPGSRIKIADAQPKRVLLKKSINYETPKTSCMEYRLKSDGLYGIYHFINGKEWDINKILQDITNKKFVDIDLEALTNLLDHPGKEVKIAPPHQPQELIKDGSIKIELSKDEMQAKIIITPPFGGRAVTKTDVMQALRENNIVIGIDDTQIEEVVRIGKERKAILTIFGEKPKPGKPAELEYLFGQQKKEAKPVELEDGRVDYRDLGLIENVKKDQVLVRKKPPKLGKPGKTVTGKETPPLPPEDIELPAGKGTKISDDGTELLAAIDGCPIIEKGKVCVLPVYEVPGDVDFKTGNIDFVGNVVVRGNVTSGFIVKAEGNVEIFGNVEDGQVIAGGKVKIMGGVYGRGNPTVEAGDEISVRFVENATLKSKTNINIGEAAMHSKIIAGKKVIVSGKKGLIVGGLVRAGEEVRCRTIGNAFATPTEIEVGVKPEEREELKGLEKRIEVDQDNLKKTQAAIETLKSMQNQMGDLPPAKKELLLKLTRTQFQLMGQLKQAIARKNELEGEIRKVAFGKVAASDRIFPGVKVTIKRAVVQITDELKFVTLTEKDEKIKTGIYK